MSSLVRQVLNHYPYLTPDASLARIMPPPTRSRSVLTVCDGIRLLCHPHAGSSEPSGQLASITDYAAGTPTVISHLLTDGDFAMDLGAGIGLATLLMARAVGPAGCVYSTESDPDLHRRLLANLAANDHPPVISRHSTDGTPAAADNASAAAPFIRLCRIGGKSCFLDQSPPDIRRLLEIRVEAILLDTPSAIGSEGIRRLQQNGSRFFHFAPRGSRVSYSTVGSDVPVAPFIAAIPGSRSDEILTEATAS